jgi:hypothetical protein
LASPRVNTLPTTEVNKLAFAEINMLNIKVKKGIEIASPQRAFLVLLRRFSVGGSKMSPHVVGCVLWGIYAPKKAKK